MQDRELLELAAKAAGLAGKWTSDGCDDRGQVRGIQTNPNYIWNPLDDDGDALRLAVKLDIHFKSVLASLFSSAGYAVNEIRMDYIHEPHGNDPYAATRRVIVRAAAEIGKNS